ncbi:Cytochrome P450 [Macrophomina phaseolina MS6]|uniref:Cytochrome P450 n=1 Tax=Macrophomina phaseolina (strain MS6) TaxID=1126212 RepID=K2RN21_MACPH|nr:Cytochrome P450 [Macrophomina phaseolina MS6]
MISASREDHSRQRRAFGYAFSERALREQEPLVQQYVDQLLSRLQEKAGQVVDLVRYYNYTTFDIIGDLTFNEPFGCLKNDDYNAFVSGVFASVKAVSFRSALAYYKWFDRLYFWLKPSGIQKGSVTFFDFTSDVVDRRLDAHIHRPDVISFIERQPEGKSLSVPELKATCFTMLIAGSETTATALSGTTYLLLKNPQAMKRLSDEIRERFRSQSEICFESTSKLPFLHAVVNEGLRMYPPVPSGFPRRVPAGGSMISGYYAPGNTAVYVAQYPAYRSKRNFTEPNSFIPERWLGEDARFDSDNFDVFMPFSNGPRNCIGKNLAYAEMHVILATVVFNFDLELVDLSSDWMDQKCFNLWDKPALGVRITPSRI